PLASRSSLRPSPLSPEAQLPRPAASQTTSPHHGWPTARRRRRAARGPGRCLVLDGRAQEIEERVLPRRKDDGAPAVFAAQLGEHVAATSLDFTAERGLEAGLPVIPARGDAGNRKKSSRS